MPIVLNSNASATSASFNLSRANDGLRKSLSRLSSGNRIINPADDAGGLAVAYKLNAKGNRTSAILQNTQNAVSYLQVQDGSLQTAGKIVDRMSELKVMSLDITKNSQDSGGSGFDLGNIHAGNPSNTALSSGGYIRDIAEVNVSQFTDIIERIADMRAGNGAEQKRLSMTMDILRSNLTNIESAHGRIMDTDIAVESTRFARQSVLVQASSSMTAQANQLTSVALQLLG